MHAQKSKLLANRHQKTPSQHLPGSKNCSLWVKKLLCPAIRSIHKLQGAPGTSLWQQVPSTTPLPPAPELSWPYGGPRYCGGERVTGRKARGLQREEIGCKCQTFLSLLSGRRKHTSNIFFPSLYKFKRRFLLKYCVAIMTPGFT